jgi:GT2 family glycosyltransferase
MKAAMDCGMESLVLLNDDAILQTTNGFGVMAEAAEKDTNIGVISSTTNLAGNLNQRPKGIGLRRESKSLAFVCVLIPKRTIDRIGWMDERFGGVSPKGEVIYGQCDRDYCRRVREAGLVTAIHDGCFVDHKSLPSSFVALNRRNSRVSAVIYEEKWGDRL